MRPSLPTRMSVTRSAEKEQRLGGFIGEYLAKISGDHRPLGNDIQVIARSVESPVVKAVASLAGEIVAAGCCVRLIIAQADRQSPPRDWALSRSVDVDCELRWARRPRLIEAHEQLVLGPETCWIGDSMRREPAKCDAYESYVDACAATAGSAAVSFERLWAASEPLLGHAPVPRASGEPEGFARRH
jgi:hypothetical protein